MGAIYLSKEHKCWNDARLLSIHDFILVKQLPVLEGQAQCCWKHVRLLLKCIHNPLRRMDGNLPANSGNLVVLPLGRQIHRIAQRQLRVRTNDLNMGKLGLSFEKT